MTHKNAKYCFGKIVALSIIAGAFFFANASCVAATTSAEGIQNIRADLAKALGCSANDRSIRKALSRELAKNNTAASANSSLTLLMGISKAQSSAP